MSLTSPYRIGIAGSTDHTLLAISGLLSDQRFEISWALTPSPKAVGRQQIITPNPVHHWAEQQKITTILINTKLDQSIKNQIEQLAAIDFLLVVDFGYIVPNWLIDLPHHAALNLHPSALPKYRGSSPGQFVLLNGETESAISLIMLNDSLDQGPIVYQHSFSVDPSWTQTEYYDFSFKLIAPPLPNLLAAYAQNQLVPQPQPATSPTATARRLKKADGFIDWETVATAMGIKTNTSPLLTSTENQSDLLLNLFQQTKSWPLTLARACRAFQPWPGLWTIIPTKNGAKRLKIMTCHQNVRTHLLELQQVQIEGQQPSLWPAVKNILLF